MLLTRGDREMAHAVFVAAELSMLFSFSFKEFDNFSISCERRYSTLLFVTISNYWLYAPYDSEQRYEYVKK